MTFVVGAAAHGSPGVSTTLQLVAASWPAAPSVPVVVESDATGGVLAARYELSLNPGFVTLAESLRQFETPALLDHAQRLPSGVACVPISPSATAASAQLRSAGPYLGPYLRQAGHPVLLDTGTLLPDGKAVPTLTAADLLLWFVRPTREELLVLRHRLAECPQPDQVAIVLVGATPYDADQVTEALGVEVLHVLPVDRRGAAAANLGGDDRYLRRSQLARSCSQLAQLIAARVGRGAVAQAEAPAAAASSVATPAAAAPPDVASTAPSAAAETTTPPPPPTEPPPPPAAAASVEAPAPPAPVEPPPLPVATESSDPPPPPAPAPPASVEAPAPTAPAPVEPPPPGVVEVAATPPAPPNEPMPESIEAPAPTAAVEPPPPPVAAEPPPPAPPASIEAPAPPPVLADVPDEIATWVAADATVAESPTAGDADPPLPDAAPVPEDPVPVWVPDSD